jgi:hypothetical protein
MSSVHVDGNCPAYVCVEAFVLKAGTFRTHISDKQFFDPYRNEVIGASLIEENKFYPFLFSSTSMGFDYILFLDRERSNRLAFNTVDKLNRGIRSAHGNFASSELPYLARLTAINNNIINCIDFAMENLSVDEIAGKWVLGSIRQLRRLIIEYEYKFPDPPVYSELGPDVSLLASMTYNSYSVADRTDERLILFASTILGLDDYNKLIKACAVLDRRLKSQKGQPEWLHRTRYYLLREIFCIVTGNHVTINPFNGEFLLSESMSQITPSIRVITYRINHGPAILEVRGDGWLDETTQLIFDNMFVVELLGTAKWGKLSHLITSELLLHHIKSSGIEESYAIDHEPLSAINVCALTAHSNLGHILWNEISGYIELAEILASLEEEAYATFYIYDDMYNKQFSDRSPKEILFPILSSILLSKTINLNIRYEKLFPPQDISLPFIQRKCRSVSFRFPIMSSDLVFAFQQYFEVRHPPLPFRILLNIRAHDKVHLNIVECLSFLLVRIVELQESNIMQKTMFAFDLEYASEDETVRDLQNLITEKGFECKMHDRIPLDSLCSLVSTASICIAPVGSGAVLSTWMFDKPTVLHGDKGHMEQLNWWNKVSPCEQLFAIPANSIVDSCSKFYSSYNIDPEAYVVTIIGAINACLCTLAP